MLVIRGSAVVCMQNERVETITCTWKLSAQVRHAIDDRRHNPRVRVPVLDVAEAMETNVAAGCIQQSQTEYRDPTLTPLMLGRDAT